VPPVTAQSQNRGSIRRRPRAFPVRRDPPPCRAASTACTPECAASIPSSMSSVQGQMFRLNPASADHSVFWPFPAREERKSPCRSFGRSGLGFRPSRSYASLRLVYGDGAEIASSPMSLSTISSATSVRQRQRTAGMPAIFAGSSIIAAARPPSAFPGRRRKPQYAVGCKEPRSPHDNGVLPDHTGVSSALASATVAGCCLPTMISTTSSSDGEKSDAG